MDQDVADVDMDGDEYTTEVCIKVCVLINVGVDQGGYLHFASYVYIYVHV